MSMTAVVTRSPLHNLSMNGAQTNGTKRKSTRLAFDPDDDAPPTKKTKADGAPKHQPALAAAGAKPPNGRATSNVKTRAAKKSYDEDDDGFAFSRTRSTRAKPKTTTPDTTAESEPLQQQQQQQRRQQQLPAAPTSPEPARPAKRKPRRTLPTTPEHERQERAPARRRSKRLSVENNQSDAPVDVKNNLRDPIQRQPQQARTHDNSVATPRLADEPAEPEASPVLEDGQETRALHVDKKRRVTKIPLPFADTPILRRNKEMRKLSAEQSRRSSSGMRGRRASSLIDAGASNAVPHSEVETQDFYKHISQDLVEPKRMRQLLMWCGHRALPGKAGGEMEAAETAAAHAARVIQEELLAEFGSRNEMSSWFDREETAPAVLVKKPNPRNIQNAEKLQQLEEDLARLQEEKRSWDSLIKSTPAAPAASSDQAEAAGAALVSLDPSDIDTTILDPSQAEILRSLLAPSPPEARGGDDSHGQAQAPSSTMPDTAGDARDRIGAIAKTLEFKLDRFADSTHRLEQYRLMAERVADRVLGSGAQKLEERDRKLRERTGGSGDVMDTLRGLGRVLNDKSRR
ncbi:hypothetical protein MBLNU459_g1030t1 [Dothideomycetes sp. NU459]